MVCILVWKMAWKLSDSRSLIKGERTVLGTGNISWEKEWVIDIFNKLVTL